MKCSDFRFYLKACNKCGESKPFSAFPLDKRQVDGRSGQCRECCSKAALNVYHTNEARKNSIIKNGVDRQRKNKVKAIEYLGGKCEDCGIVGHPSIYDFHHLNPEEKEHTPNKLRGRSWEVQLKEINKCILLCSNCHRLRHYKEIV